MSSKERPLTVVANVGCTNLHLEYNWEKDDTGVLLTKAADMLPPMEMVAYFEVENKVYREGSFWVEVKPDENVSKCLQALHPGQWLLHKIQIFEELNPLKPIARLISMKLVTELPLFQKSLCFIQAVKAVGHMSPLPPPPPPPVVTGGPVAPPPTEVQFPVVLSPAGEEMMLTESTPPPPPPSVAAAEWDRRMCRSNQGMGMTACSKQLMDCVDETDYAWGRHHQPKPKPKPAPKPKPKPKPVVTKVPVTVPAVSVTHPPTHPNTHTRTLTRTHTHAHTHSPASVVTT